MNCAMTSLVLTARAASVPVPWLDPAKAETSTDDDTLWYDILDLGLEGRGWNDTNTPYDRLPAKAEPLVRPPVWGLSLNSAGMAVRFRTDATRIKARWTLRSDSLAMNHMPATGVSGIDLYARMDDGPWHWLAVGRPSAPENETELVGDLPAGERDYLLYLPLYNGVSEVTLGVPWDSRLGPTRPPRSEKPILFYGTSITQGGCASRPGMVYTAILGRRLDARTINLGFSGNGLMEPELADLLAELDPSIYVLDCLANMTADLITERVEPFVRTLRTARPDTPIVLLEDRTYAHAFLVAKVRERNQTSRAALRRAYGNLREAGVPGLHYVEGDRLFGDDGEATVDGSHATDLGFMRQANLLEPLLESLLSDASTG